MALFFQATPPVTCNQKWTKTYPLQLTKFCRRNAIIKTCYISLFLKETSPIWEIQNKYENKQLMLDLRQTITCFVDLVHGSFFVCESCVPSKYTASLLSMSSNRKISLNMFSTWSEVRKWQIYTTATSWRNSTLICGTFVLWTSLPSEPIL
jgi:hypothetical protein